MPTLYAYACTYIYANIVPTCPFVHAYIRSWLPIDSCRYSVNDSMYLLCLL